MRRPIVTFIVAIIAPSLAALPAAAEIDLVPRSMMIGGGLVHRTYFADGTRRFAVTIDAETTISAANGGALFRFTNVSQASMRLARSPVEKPVPFNAESLPDYLKTAEKMLPPGAASVVLVASSEGVLPVNHWKSYRFHFSYQVGGLGYEEAITFLFMDSGEQIAIQTGSQRKDFAVIAERADDIFRRWHELQPGDEGGPN